MIDSLNKEIENISIKVIEKLEKGNLIELSYNDQGKLENQDKIEFNHSGLYSFIIKRNTSFIVVYLGKNEGGDRLRQHITGENKNGTPLKESVKTKHEKIISAIGQGFKVYLSTYENCAFTKASLSAIEIGCIEHLKNLEHKNDFPQSADWNTRLS